MWLDNDMTMTQAMNSTTNFLLAIVETAIRPDREAVAELAARGIIYQWNGLEWAFGPR
jgi:hypothetical protein